MDAHPRLPWWNHYAWVNIPRSGLRIKPVSRLLSVWSLRKKDKHTFTVRVPGLLLFESYWVFLSYLLSYVRSWSSVLYKMGEPTVSQTVGLVEAVPRMSFVLLHVHSYMCKCSRGSEITELLIGLLNISRASLRTNKRLWVHSIQRSFWNWLQRGGTPLTTTHKASVNAHICRNLHARRPCFV